MTITLRCWMKYGKLGGSDWERDFEVTEEEYDRLKEVAAKGEFFGDAEEVEDIYERLYDEMIAEATEQMLEDDEDLAEEYGDDDDWTADELYDFGLEFIDDFGEEDK